MGVINPIKLLGFSFFVWLFFYVQIPVRYLYVGDAFFAVFTIVLFITSFVIGAMSFKSNGVKTIKGTSTKKLKQIVFLFFLIGLIGVLLKVYVGIFTTGIFTAQDILQKRIENMSKELTGGVIGVISSMLYPFSYIAFLIGIYNYKNFNKIYLLLVIIIGLYPLVETFFMGGRTTIALLGTTILFVAYASFFKNGKFTLLIFKLFKTPFLLLPKFLFKKKVLIPLAVISLLFVSYSIKVIDERLTLYNYGDSIFKVWEQKDYQWVKFDEDYKEKYYEASPEQKSRMIGLYSLKHYFVHGVFEYVRLVNDLNRTTGYHYGRYEFDVFFKFFRAMGIPLDTSKEMSKIVSRQAVYQTFWGPFYIDFGVFGVFIMFFWGRFVKRVYVHAKRGSTPHVIFYSYFATIIITSFFINFLLGSSSYFLFAFFITLLVFKYWPNNLSFIIKKQI